jgi:hypothetical protein
VLIVQSLLAERRSDGAVLTVSPQALSLPCVDSWRVLIGIYVKQLQWAAVGVMQPNNMVGTRPSETAGEG